MHPTNPGLPAKSPAGRQQPLAHVEAGAGRQVAANPHCLPAPFPQVVLFLFQLEMDSQLQRALTYERFDIAQVPPAGQACRGAKHELRDPRCSDVRGFWLAMWVGGSAERAGACRGAALAPALTPPGARPPALAHLQEVRARRQQVDAALGELQQLKGPGCGARVAGRSDQMEYAPQIMTLKAQVGTWSRAVWVAHATGLGGHVALPHAGHGDGSRHGARAHGCASMAPLLCRVAGRTGLTKPV